MRSEIGANVCRLSHEIGYKRRSRNSMVWVRCDNVGVCIALDPLEHAEDPFRSRSAKAGAVSIACQPVEGFLIAVRAWERVPRVKTFRNTVTRNVDRLDV